MLLRACFIVPAPAKLKIVGFRSVRSDVSVPFADFPPNRGHSEYYSCQTVLPNCAKCVKPELQREQNNLDEFYSLFEWE